MTETRDHLEVTKPREVTVDDMTRHKNICRHLFELTFIRLCLFRPRNVRNLCSCCFFILLFYFFQVLNIFYYIKSKII